MLDATKPRGRVGKRFATLAATGLLTAGMMTVGASPASAAKLTCGQPHVDRNLTKADKVTITCTGKGRLDLYVNTWHGQQHHWVRSVPKIGACYVFTVNGMVRSVKATVK